MQIHKKHQQSNKISFWKTFFNIKKVSVLSVGLLLFSSIFFSENIKAQIASIISEDGDGIIGVTSLMNAVISQDLQSAQFFAKAPTSVINQKNIGGATALHIAARNGNIEIVRTLIENGANVNLSDNEGWTPLMRASLSKNPELVKIFLDAGADAKKTNAFGETAIIHCAYSECLECFRQLFSKYDFANNMDFDSLTQQLESSINIVRNKNNSEIELLIKNYLNIELAKSRGVNPNIDNPNGAENFADKEKNNGIVIVKSLDDKIPESSQSNKKSAYKFLPEHKNLQKNSAKQGEEISQEFQSNQINKSKNVAKNGDKKFIFNGSKKSTSYLEKSSEKSLEKIPLKNEIIKKEDKKNSKSEEIIKEDKKNILESSPKKIEKTILENEKPAQKNPDINKNQKTNGNSQAIKKNDETLPNQESSDLNKESFVKDNSNKEFLNQDGTIKKYKFLGQKSSPSKIKKEETNNS